MTAERWWVRLAARWLARIDGVAGHLRLAMLGLTGVSTATLTLKQYGHGEYAWPFIAVTGVGVFVYAYFYSEGGVWNQTARDRTDMSDNYSGPTMLMDARIEARQLARLAYSLQNGDPADVDEIEDMLLAATEEEWLELRDGVELPEDDSQ